MDVQEVNEALPRYRHIKTGGVYEILADRAQLTTGQGGVPQIVYRNVKTGLIWVRSRDEFMDGRFEALAPSTVAQRVAAAQDEMATWTPERRANAQLEGAPKDRAWVATKPGRDVIHFSEHDGWTVEQVIGD